MENNIDIKKVYDQLLEYGSMANRKDHEMSAYEYFMLDQIALLATNLKIML